MMAAVDSAYQARRAAGSGTTKAPGWSAAGSSPSTAMVGRRKANWSNHPSGRRCMATPAGRGSGQRWWRAMAAAVRLTTDPVRRRPQVGAGHVAPALGRHQRSGHPVEEARTCDLVEADPALAGRLAHAEAEILDYCAETGPRVGQAPRRHGPAPLWPQP